MTPHICMQEEWTCYTETSSIFLKYAHLKLCRIRTWRITTPSYIAALINHDISNLCSLTPYSLQEVIARLRQPHLLRLSSDLGDQVFCKEITSLCTQKSVVLCILCTLTLPPLSSPAQHWLSFLKKTSLQLQQQVWQQHLLADEMIEYALSYHSVGDNSRPFIKKK